MTHYEKFYEQEKNKFNPNLIVRNAANLSCFELDAIRTAFKHSVKIKLKSGGERYYTAGIDFPNCCDVLISLDSDGNYIAEVK